MNSETLLKKASPSGDCLLLGNPKSSRRYWSVAFNGRRLGAHRVMWLLLHGQIPEGLEVCHRCDNTRCINPDHLFLGTHLENMRDRDQKGRCGTLGEKSPLAKLNSAKVIDIYNRATTGIKPREIAAQFGVSEMTVVRIFKKQTWKHLLPAASATANL